MMSDHQGDTYRTVYSLRLQHAVYVLRAFQKKSKRGIETAQQDMELIRQRLKRAEELDAEAASGGEMSGKIKFERSSGNVFADLGIPRPAEALAKARLALEIERTIRKRGLTQARAGEILEIDQPKVSALRNGRLSGFSVERLIRFLNALNRDVEIVVRTKPRSRGRGRLSVRAA